AILAPAKAYGTARHHQTVAGLVPGQGFPFGIVGLAQVVGDIAGAQLLAGHQAAIGARFQLHEDRHVGVAPHVVGEIGAGVLQVELLEDHVAHGDGQRRVGTLFGAQPLVTELGHLRIVRGDGHGLGALVAHLGEEVRVGAARLRHVGAPGDDVARVVPVGRFRHVGLLAPGLRAGGREVAVPVVKAQAHAADQRQITGAGGVADHGHGRNWREADHSIRTVLLDGVDVGGGYKRLHLVPVGAHETAETAVVLVLSGAVRVLDDARPGPYRVRVPGQGG